MTRIDKSPEQLDAEAAASREERTLPATLARHRKLYRQDAWIERLTTETPPVIVDPDSGRRIADDMSMIGPTLSARLERYVSGAYGYDFPWARAFAAMRQMCMGVHHPHRERIEWRGSLCYSLVSLTVIGELTVDAACTRLGVTPQRAGLTLRTALLWVEAEMRRRAEAMVDRDRALEGMRQAREEAGIEGIPVHVHHRVPGLHEAECPHPVCKGDRAA